MSAPAMTSYATRSRIFLLLFALFLMLAFASRVVHSATLVVVNNDAAGVGFNETTPATPVGGNTGTTLGAQRLNAFQYAANIWGGLLSSSVPIRIRAQFAPLSCTSTSGVLGSAGPVNAFRDFTGAPVAGTYYPVALANALRGSDLDSSGDDISASFNGAVGTTGCLDTSGWYFGLDASPPSGKIDFVSVLVHELGHGLGFLTFVDLASGAKPLGFNDTFMRNLEDHGATPSDFPSMSDAQRVAASKDSGNLHWVGANVKAASGTLSAGAVSDHVRMYAPNPQQSGSSVSHWDTALTPDQIMEPSYTAAHHNPSLELPLFKDIGWTLLSAGACSYTLGASSVSIGSGATSGTVSVTAATGCTWSASSNASYITVTSGASGSGNGTVNYAVAANTGSSARSGTLTIAGQTFTVTQAAASSGALADLQPYAPSGWSDSIVATQTLGSKTTPATFTTTSPVYFNFAFANVTSQAITASFVSKLFVDGVLNASYTTNGLAASTYLYATDISLGTLSAGTHTIQMQIDTGNTVAESNEDNNSYTISFTVTAPATPPVCTLSASPSSISAGGSSTLSASCTPAATSYTWTGTSFSSSASSGSVSPSSTTIYSVVGTNAVGSGAKANAAVIVGTSVASQTDVRTYVPAASASSGYTSYLRVINAGSSATPVSVARIDGATGAVGTWAVLTPSLAARGAHTFSAQQVEAALGSTMAASDRPRIRVSGHLSVLEVQSFLLQPGGLFDEISAAQSGSTIMLRTYIPSGDASSGYTSYVRIINPGSAATPVSIALVDGETGALSNASTLIASMPGGAAQTFSSSQIEAVMGTIPAGSRSRLQISGTSTLEVQSFITQPGGAFTNISGGQ